MRRHLRTRGWPLAAVMLLLALARPVLAGGPPEERHLVACAPGYPGSPTQAQPTLDAFAGMIGDAAGWQAGSLTAEYTSDEEDGVEAIAGGADLAIVPTPFFVAHAEELDLRPLLQSVPPDGGAEIWTLVAPRGRVTTPADLAGWELTGIPGYAPGFVRAALRSWGTLPASVRITYTDRVLGALRKVLAGKSVAVLLDGPQTEALPSLPDAESVQIVARSEPVPPLILAAVGDRLQREEIEAVRTGLPEASREERFAELLATLRVSGFEPADEVRLEELRVAALAASR